MHLFVTKMKNILKHLTLLLAIMLLVGSNFYIAQAQDIKKANEKFDLFSFPEAAEMYKKILSKSDIPEAKIKLADCYRLMNMPVEAEYWYEQVVGLSESEPIHKYYYGMALKANGKFDEGKQAFIEYAQAVPADTRGLRQVEACDQHTYFETDPGIYSITACSAINTEKADFGPAFYKEGIVYCSESNVKDKSKIYNWREAPFLDFFYAKAKSPDNPADLETGEILKGKINSWVHEGTLAFAKDGGTVYFTRNNFLNGKIGYDTQDKIKTINLQLCQAKLEGEDKWTDIKLLPFNSNDYSVGHPTISADGQALYFTSDMPGGYGGTDIYVSYKSGDSWGQPENLGPEINTEGNEMFPYMSAEGILYFSSDALPGLGGLDVFSSKLQEDGTWTAPENLRNPINTNADDFAFILDDKNEKGYFSSNRSGGKGDDDIYSFTRLNNIMNGIVIDCKTKEAIKDATVKLIEGKNVMQKKKTGPTGSFSFPVSPGKEYKIEATKSGYEDGSQTLLVDDSGTSINIKIPICPKGIDPNALANGDSSALKNGPKCVVQGVIREKGGTAPVSGAIVKLTNIDTRDEKTFVTGADGTYTFELDPESDFIIHAIKERYFTETKTVTTKGIDCASPQERNLTMYIDLAKIPLPPPPNGDPNPDLNKKFIFNDNGKGSENLPGWFQLNHIYYDFDKDFIREDAKIELDKVVRLLSENPGISLELGSHTDSRASDAYNQDLSERRARSAVNYIVSRGIDAARIVPHGYGETQLANECGNGVKCSQSKHQENRRTEFTITGYNANAGSHSLPRYFGRYDFGASDIFRKDRYNFIYKGTDGSYYDSKGNVVADPSTFISAEMGTAPAPSSSSNNIENEITIVNAGKTTTAKNNYYSEQSSSSSSYSVPPTNNNNNNSLTYYDNPTSSGSNCCAFPNNTSSNTGTQFKIQLAATKHPNLQKYASLNDIGNVSTEGASSGVDRVVLGIFPDGSSAENALNQIHQRGFKDAFVVKYQDGLRIGK